MTDADIKIVNFMLDHITKVFLAQTDKILAEVGKRNRGPKPVAASIALQRRFYRARNELAKSRAENRELHKLLDQQINK